MKVLWLCLAAVCLVVCTAERGGSLRGALEALQRRQRGRVHVPIEPSDYEAFYDFVPPPAYAEPDYSVDTENGEDEASPKYIVRLLENERPSEAYEYKIIKKKSAYNNRPNPNTRQLSPFRERSQHSDNDRLRDLFMDRDGDAEESRHILENEGDNDIEYAVLLDQLWSKYKNNQGRSKNDDNAEGVVKLYKDKIIKKRFPNNWGPVAFKRKRSPDSNIDQSVMSDSEYIKNNGDTVPRNSNYNSYEVSDNDDDNDKDDMREEYAIAFQPLNDDGLTDLADEDQYAYETIEKRFPVTKRSSEPYNFNSQKKRFAPDHNKRDTKTFRNSAGTDPKIIRDLSKIFGNAETEFIKSPVKRNTDNVQSLHDTKPPTLVLSHNHTELDHNLTIHDDMSHEENGHKIHPPGVFGKEEHTHNNQELEHAHDKDHKHNHDNDQHDDNDQETEKPIKIKKKSIDWSDYFGIDKRLKKSVSFVNNLNEDRLKKQYFDTFNKEVIYPLNSFRKNNYAKRNYVQPNENTDDRMNNDQSLTKDEKRNSGNDNESKLDNIDKKLKNMEGIIVDEALHYSNIGEELDSKEEQEMKEKLLSRLAAAYSLEKMRKALKEFKQSLQMQKASSVIRSTPDHTDDKYKRVVIKKEKVLMNNELPIPSEKNDDFEDEQGAGHYLNGKMEEQLSEGYMGGSGSHHTPVMSTVSSMGACPVLAKIVQRCRGVDLLAGDRGQLFLPLCSLHQICYLCGEAPPTTCDLVFLSEADSSCEGDMSCQRAARSALMALRELHENLVDELAGECEASPCLAATLKLNLGWQRALHR